MFPLLDQQGHEKAMPQQWMLLQPEVCFNDWFPALQMAVEWNNWDQDEFLSQLAGHHRGVFSRNETYWVGQNEKYTYDTAG